MTTRELKPQEREFLVEYLGALDAGGVPSLLLRNYQEFPNAIGNDLDLFVFRDRLEAATRLFLRLLADAGGQLLMRNRRDYVLDLRFLFGENIADTLHLDLYHGAFTWHGQPYLPAGILIAESVAHRNGFRVPRAAHEALNLVLASLLWGGFFKARYQPRIAKLLGEPAESDEFTRCLKQAIGAEGRLEFDPRDPNLPSPEIALRCAQRLRRALLHTAFVRDKLAAVVNWTRHWLVEFRTVLRPRGLHIVILGPEESSRGRVIAAVERSVGKVFVDTHVHHRKPWSEPDCGKEEGPSLRRVSICDLLRNLVGCLAGYMRRIVKRKAQSHLVIEDHHPIEFWCDFVRYRIALPVRLFRGLCAAIPAADFTFILADAVASGNGKNRGDTEAAEKTAAAYRQFAKGSRRRIVIDAAQGSEGAARQIERVISEFLIRRELHCH